MKVYYDKEHFEYLRDANDTYDPYTVGVYNGIEFMMACLENRDPIFKKACDREYCTTMSCENCIYETCEGTVDSDSEEGLSEVGE